MSLGVVVAGEGAPFVSEGPVHLEEVCVSDLEARDAEIRRRESGIIRRFVLTSRPVSDEAGIVEDDSLTPPTQMEVGPGVVFVLEIPLIEVGLLRVRHQGPPVGALDPIEVLVVVEREAVLELRVGRESVDRLRADPGPGAHRPGGGVAGVRGFDVPELEARAEFDADLVVVVVEETEPVRVLRNIGLRAGGKGEEGDGGAHDQAPSRNTMGQSIARRSGIAGLVA